MALVACGDDGSRGKVPDPLDTIEAQAEDIIDIVPANEWAKVRADVNNVVEAWDEYRARALRDGASQKLVDRFDDALERLRTAADAEQATESMQRANDVSAATVELFGLYDTLFPVDIGRLDVIGRQIVFAADRQDLTDAERQVARAHKAIWDGGLERRRTRSRWRRGRSRDRHRLFRATDGT